jgi:hypothetical protein
MKALFPIATSAGWGYMNREGDTVVPPLHEACRPFFEQRGAARRDRRYAFFDHRGTQLCDFEFDDVGHFSGGLCAVKKAGRWRYLDRSLREVLVVSFRSCFEFNDGVAVVYNSLLEYHHIDVSGKVVARDNAVLASCSEGRFAFRQDARTKVGFKDRAGRWAIPPTFSAAGEFGDGIAVVRLTDDGPHAFIDVEGEELLRTDRDFLLPRFSEGLVAFSDARSRRFGFLNRHAEVAIPAQYDTVEAFSAGRSLATRGDRSFFLNRHGEIAIDLGRANASSFRHGLAWIAAKSGFAYIDLDGNQVWCSAKTARRKEAMAVKKVIRRAKRKLQKSCRTPR